MADCGGENVVMEETMRTETDEIRDNLKYLTLLARDYPSQAAAASEIISTQALLKLPKGTEHFMSDLHGENEAFVHILNSASGVIREKVDAVLGDTMPEAARAELATLIYYPTEKLPQLKARCTTEDALEQWYTQTLLQLIDICRLVSSKHTRDHVRGCLPSSCGYILDELLHAHFEDHDKDLYYGQIVGSIIENGRADRFIVRLCELIKHLAVDKLHIVGDLFDRGPRPDIILDLLMRHHNVDIQWGNHDIVWMGAALGQRGCIAHVVRNCARYGNLSILSDAYGINLLPLANFALKTYKDDPCVGYALKGNPNLSPQELDLTIKIQKAMAILQFKVEAKHIDDNPSFNLEDRKLLHKINLETNTVEVDGIEYEITDPVFPTVDWTDPYQLTDEEEAVMQAFLNCEKLQRHMALLLEKGSLYKIENNTLMYHACVPLNPDGTLKEVNIYGKTYKGKALFDAVDKYVRDAFTAKDPESHKRGCDLLWYLWLGEGSPLFAKSKMATFEIYLIKQHVKK